MLASWKKSYDKPSQCIKKQRHHFANKGPSIKAMVFPVVMYGYESWNKEEWAPKNCCFQTVVLEKTLESPFDCKEIKPVNPKGNLFWIFIGRTDAQLQYLATSCKEPIHWKIPWCWQRLRAGWERDDRGWDGWMASLT